MSQFLVRVELHSANYSDYETLHAQMRRSGFTQTISSDDGVTYHLPTAEYYYTGNVSRSNVLDSAKAAAATTRKSGGVIVAEATGLTWSGLTRQ